MDTPKQSGCSVGHIVGNTAMYWISKSIHWLGRLNRRGLILFLAVLGPGIITMVADNDAGGISTYAQTGAKTGFNLLWAFIILCRWPTTSRR